MNDPDRHPKAKRKWLFVTTFIAMCVSINAQSNNEVEEQEIIPPKAEGMLKAPIPSELKHLMIENPHVDFTLLIDENGNVQDSLPIKSNHYKLLPAAEKFVANVKFKPGTLNGEPQPMRHQIRVSIVDYTQEIWRDSGQLPMGSSSIDGADRRIYDRSKEAYIYEQSEVNELDKPLQIMEGKTVLMQDENGQNPVGSCVIEYFIDSEGGVKLPQVLESDNDNVSLSALASLRAIRFSKPEHKGVPTYVKVRQRFNYGNEDQK